MEFAPRLIDCTTELETPVPIPIMPAELACIVGRLLPEVIVV